MAQALDKVNKFPICAKPKLLKSGLKTANINPEPEGCSLVPTCVTHFLVLNFHSKLPLDYLNMYTLDVLQMILITQRDPLLFLNSVANPPTCHD